MKKILATIAVASAVVAIHPANAMPQFSLPSIPGLSKSSGASSADLDGQQTQLVRNYVAANKDVLNANASMADALNLKTNATAYKATADALGDGATKDNLDSANKGVSESNSNIAAALANNPKLDAESKIKFGVGLASLASGVVKYAGMGKDVQSMASGLSSASPMQLPGLASAATVVSKFPDSLASVSLALKNAVAFAQSNDIPVPASATAAMSLL